LGQKTGALERFPLGYAFRLFSKVLPTIPANLSDLASKVHPPGTATEASTMACPS